MQHRDITALNACRQCVPGGGSLPHSPRAVPCDKGGEHGAAMIVTILLMSLMFVIGLIAVNAAMMFTARASEQRAADAAALAGCRDLPNATNAQASAIKYGASSGGLNATTTANLESGNGAQTVLNPNAADGLPMVRNSGAVSAASGQPLVNDKIVVDVRRTQPLIGQVSTGFAAQTIGAHAACTRAEGGLPVLLVLQPTGQYTLKIQQVQLNLGNKGGIVVDSTDPAALGLLGGGSISAKWIDTASGTGSLCGSCSISPGITQGTQPDPYASVPEPPVPTVSDPKLAQNIAGCNYGPAGATTPAKPQMCTVASGSVPSICPASPTTFVFWGGLTLGDGSAKTINLCAGSIYYMAGGGFNVASNATVNGSNVMIFNGEDQYANPSQKKCGQILINDFAQLLLTPPAFGTYKDLMIFQSRDLTNCNDSSSTLQIESGVTIGLASGPYGVVYVPAGEIDMGPQSLGSGGPLDKFNAIFIAGRFFITGPVQFNNPFIPSGNVNHGDVKLTE
jgi:Flp pilus assembly protein TadG